jgi:hypothetical protein
VTKELGKKMQNVYGWGLKFIFLSANVLAMSASTLKKFLATSKKVVLDCIYIQFNRPNRILFFIFLFLLCLKVVFVWV